MNPEIYDEITTGEIVNNVSVETYRATMVF